jgi:hypothetical protein
LQQKTTQNKKPSDKVKVFVADALVVHMGGREGVRESLTYWKTANHDQI